MQSATWAASALLGQSRTTPVWRSTSRRSSESSCSRMVLVAINLCIEVFPQTAGEVFSVLSSQFLVSGSPFVSVARRGGDAVLARVAFHLLSHHVHFLFNRRKTLQHLVDAQRHVANGFNLRAGLGGKAAGFDQQQIGVAEKRSQRV